MNVMSEAKRTSAMNGSRRMALAPSARSLPLAAWLSLALLGLCGCYARRGEPLVGPPPLTTPGEVRGEQAYVVHCGQCHPGGEGGLGPALSTKPSPGVAMKLQVRQGFGAMPKFSEEKLSELDLDAIVDYLIVNRRNRE